METPTTRPLFQLTKSPFTIDNEVPFTSSPFQRYLNVSPKFLWIYIYIYHVFYCINLGYDYMNFTLITLQKRHYPKLNANCHWFWSNCIRVKLLPKQFLLMTKQYIIIHCGVKSTRVKWIKVIPWIVEKFYQFNHLSKLMY